MSCTAGVGVRFGLVWLYLDWIALDGLCWVQLVLIICSNSVRGDSQALIFGPFFALTLVLL